MKVLICFFVAMLIFTFILFNNNCFFMRERFDTQNLNTQPSSNINNYCSADGVASSSMRDDNPSDCCSVAQLKLRKTEGCIDKNGNEKIDDYCQCNDCSWADSCCANAENILSAMGEKKFDKQSCERVCGSCGNEDCNDPKNANSYKSNQ